MWNFFKQSALFSVLGIVISGFLGFQMTGLAGAIEAVFITLVLAVLEISLSFDNAIVNATVLKKMTPLWQHRFLTWGILIAVFGMRLLFPVIIVSVIAHLSPWTALNLALFDQAQYAKIMVSAHTAVSAFGGAFLLLVGLKYFFDETKESHWIISIERFLVKMGRLAAVEIAITILCLIIVAQFLQEDEIHRFIFSGLWGILLFVAVDGLSVWLEASEKTTGNIHKASAGMFVYLEVLDASFSFDGVIGAFAITQNLIIILIGLSIGALFVRSLTILFVKKDILKNFAFLEHGAFYAILSLAMIMLMDPIFHIPEWVTGLVGAAIIVISFIWSVKFAPLES